MIVHVVQNYDVLLTLLKYSVEQNYISDRGATAVATGLRSNNFLRRLRLDLKCTWLYAGFGCREKGKKPVLCTYLHVHVYNCECVDTSYHRLSPAHVIIDDLGTRSYLCVGGREPGYEAKCVVLVYYIEWSIMVSVLILFIS